MNDYYVARTKDNHKCLTLNESYLFDVDNCLKEKFCLINLNISNKLI